MTLKFAPLGFIFHDGWTWRQSKTLMSYDQNGNPKPMDDSKKCYQRGHIHLFLPTVEYAPSGSSLAYWGQQTYSFKIVDEWGPNSNDPSQNKSVRLIGKPLWYLYVEEYWRRMYIQPWDVVDDTCTLPLNQEIAYVRRGVEEYYHELIGNVPTRRYDGEEDIMIDLHKSVYNGEAYDFTDCQLDGRNEDGTAFYIPRTYPYDSVEGQVDTYWSFVGFNDYLTQQRRLVARRLFIGQESCRQMLMQWLASMFGDIGRYDEVSGSIIVTSHYDAYSFINGNNENAYRLRGTLEFVEPNGVIMTLKEKPDDSVIVEFLYMKTTTTDSVTGSTMTTSLIGAFNEFFRHNASRNAGYVEIIPVLEAFMKMHGVAVPEKCKPLEGGAYILVPSEKTTGHVGIRFDASKPCHSLGPFMEGGEFYFFNTVVNRSMPCEYWLDEEMKTRQYFIKREWADFAEAGKDTAGGQTWTFSGDNSKFIWVQNTFSEAQGLLGDDYEPDTGGQYYYVNRRLPNLHSSSYYTCAGMNAKRLKDTIPSTPSGNRDNTKIPHEKYSFLSSNDQSEGQTTGATVTVPTYSENGVDTNERTESSPEQPEKPLKTLQWETDGWTGWYDKDEIIHCSIDDEWYIRSWSPMRYSTESRFGGQQPYWSQQKRQSFPNPSPWLCDSSEGTQRYSTDTIDAQHQSVLPESLAGVAESHWCTDTRAYDNDEDTRIHLLHWEYALYFGLARVYPERLPDNPKTLRRHFFIYSTDSVNQLYKLQFIVENADGNGEYVAPHDRGSDWYVFAKEENLVNEIPADWETLMEEYADENGGYPTDIETENSLFSEWISALGSGYFMRFEDRDIRWYSSGGYYDTQLEIVDYRRNDHEDGTFDYTIWVETGSDYTTYTVSSLPSPVYTVSYNSPPHSFPDYHSQTYITFDEFRQVWTPLTMEEKTRLRLFGDMPRRNRALYGGDLTASGSLDAQVAYPELFDQSITKEEGEKEFKMEAIGKVNEGLQKEQSPSLLISEFMPRIDEEVRAHNSMKDVPHYRLSELDEIGDELTEQQWGEMPKDDKMRYLRWYTETGEPIDPYRNGTVNPIDTWRKYFDRREVFTIPDGTTVLGDKGITNDEGSPNSPSVHPREASFSHEDGARRHYPDDFYVSPVIEYQKIIRKDYERPNGKEQEEEWLNATVDGKPNWKTDAIGNWGDGFEITVEIPWKVKGEIQSPFSEADNVTKPIGEYCHDCVKPENMLRHHIEFYDSLDQIRKYDFPNYVRIIHAFQKQCLPSGVQKENPRNESVTCPDGTQTIVELDGTDFTKSYYREDFNDFKATEKLRKNEKDENLADYNAQRKGNGLAEYRTWQDALDEYWVKINGNDQTPQQNIYINMPVMRSMDCHGNRVKENSFEMLDNGCFIWREQTTSLMPEKGKVEFLSDHETPGYLDSKGNHIKGGGKVRFNNPYPENTDGKWYEECLGAIVKARCVLVLEDALGYRWRQVVEATALQPDQPIRGSDYEG